METNKPKRVNAFQRKEMTSRRPVWKHSIIIFDESSKHLQCFNPGNKAVIQIHEYNEEMKRVIFTSISIGDHIYVLAAGRSMYRLKYCDVTDTWERMADLNVDHGFRPPSVVASGSIVIVGGSYPTATKSVSTYDISLNRWEKLKDKQLDTRESANVASQGFVYCLGGRIEDIGVTDRVERLNVVSQSWDEVASMQNAREAASAAECDGNMFVAGGGGRDYDLLNSVEKYNPDVNQWTTVKPLTTQRSFFRCHLIDGSIFAVGPENEGIEKYVEGDDREVVKAPQMEILNIWESVATNWTTVTK